MKFQTMLTKLASDDGLSSKKFEKFKSKLEQRFGPDLVTEFCNCCVVDPSGSRIAIHVDLVPTAMYIATKGEMPPENEVLSEGGGETIVDETQYTWVQAVEYVKFRVEHAVQLPLPLPTDPAKLLGLVIQGNGVGSYELLIHKDSGVLNATASQDLDFAGTTFKLKD